MVESSGGPSDGADPGALGTLPGRVPPGQVVRADLPATHYGSVPRLRPESWDFTVLGATADGGATRWAYDDVCALPQVDVVADLHCVTRFTVLDLRWTGVPARALLDAAPPDTGVSRAIVWADRGYTANVRIADLLADTTLLAHSLDGAALTPEHGWPLRLVVPHLYGWKGPKWVRGIEYVTDDRRGFWEQRGYHDIGDPWTEQRWSYQEGSADDRV